MRSHPRREQLPPSCLRDGVSALEFMRIRLMGWALNPRFGHLNFRGRYSTCNGGRNVRAPDACLYCSLGPGMKWIKPRRPPLIQPLSTEPSKPRFICYAYPLNHDCRQMPFNMDTMGTVGQVGWQGCFQGSLDYCSGFHHVFLHPQSWSLFGFCWQGVDYVWTTLPFGCNESPLVYRARGSDPI